jgi:hypothetical protein
MRLHRLAAAVACALALHLPAFATPITDMHAEDLLQMAPDLRTALNLTPNQLTLWQQVEGKSHALLRERQARRAALQDAALKLAQTPNADLRQLASQLDADQQAAAAEERQLREWWLTVNDALDDRQRQAVLNLVAEQLQKVHAEPAMREGGRGEGGGERGRHGGGMGGMGGRGARPGGG